MRLTQGLALVLAEAAGVQSVIVIDRDRDRDRDRQEDAERVLRDHIEAKRIREERERQRRGAELIRSAERDRPQVEAADAKRARKNAKREKALKQPRKNKRFA